MPVAVLVALTAAPGIAAPEGSLTLPVSVPYRTWASTGIARATMAVSANKVRSVRDSFGSRRTNQPGVLHSCLAPELILKSKQVLSIGFACVILSSSVRLAEGRDCGRWHM